MNEFSMHDAVKEDDLEKVRQLIAAGVSVDSLNERGDTPLLVATSSAKGEVAGLLIDSGCDVDIKDRHGHTPLMWAAERGMKDIVDLLLHRGAQVNCADCCSGETPLMIAARNGDREVAALLIRAGADVNRSDEMKRTALHLAVFYERTRVIPILLEKEGLDLNPQDVNGDTPLHLACHPQHFCLDPIKQLLGAGADTNVKNNRGKTALSEGIGRISITPEEIRLFVQKGAFLENCDYERLSLIPFRYVLKDVEFCTQSVVNKFNRQSLSALNNIAYFARRLPNVDNFKLGARHIDEVENLVKCEIERNTFCNVVRVRPIALSALCVLSLITGWSQDRENREIRELLGIFFALGK